MTRRQKLRVLGLRMGRAVLSALFVVSGSFASPIAWSVAAMQVDSLPRDTLAADSLPAESLVADSLAADSPLADSLSVEPVVLGEQPRQVARVDTAGRGRPSPSGAFLRSLVLPGWGQAASGAYSRAVFYVLLESSSAYMLVKTQRTLTAARDRVAFREEVATRQAMEAGLSDPDSIQAFLDGDDGVEDARALAESRSQQREDWLAFGLAMLLLGGADAFVSAHLSDFPDALTVEARGLPNGSPAAEIRVALPWSPEWLGGPHKGN